MYDSDTRKLSENSVTLHWSDGLLCVSLQKESVALALSVIDESEVRGYKLHVEAARFELKGQYDASKKKKKSKDYKKKMQQQQKWAVSSLSLHPHQLWNTGARCQ